MMRYGWDTGVETWIWMGVFWLLLIAIVVFLVARLFPGDRRDGRERRDTAQDILDRRLASGEIDVEGYKQIRAELGSRRGR